MSGLPSIRSSNFKLEVRHAGLDGGEGETQEKARVTLPEEEKARIKLYHMTRLARLTPLPV